VKLLVIQTAYLGDTVFTSALVASLLRLGEVEVCVAPRGADVALAMPGVSKVHVFDKRGVDRGLSGLRRMAERLQGFDVAVIPHRSMRSALLARLAKIPRRIGFAGAPGSVLYTERVKTKARGFVEQEADLAKHLGAAPQPMRLQPLPAHLKAVQNLLPQGEPLAAICLGSEWETKIWPEAHVAQLVRTLRGRGLTPVLLGGPKERETARAIPACVDTTGNPIGEAIAILSLCSLAVGGDTGLVHAARALGIPTVAVFGPTPVDVHDFGQREAAVTLGLDCSPCSAHGSRVCPLGHHKCMRDLDAAPVAAACLRVIA
jgi:heptosyltransferase-2